jgi:hypothetical protein
MDQEALDLLRNAGHAMLRQASAAVVMRALRVLLDEEEGAETEPALNGVHRTKPIVPAPTTTTPPAKQTQVKQEQPEAARVREFRIRVRSTMRERGMTYRTLAEQLAVAEQTLTGAVSKARPMSRPMRAKLERWLAAPDPSPALPRAAKEVPAAAVGPFRGNGGGAAHSSNSAAHPHGRGAA